MHHEVLRLIRRAHCRLLLIHKLLVGATSIGDLLLFSLFFAAVGLVELLTLALQLLLQPVFLFLPATRFFILLGLGFLHLPLEVHLQLALLISFTHLPCVGLLADLELMLV